MGETKIEWADFTFNPWVGCTKLAHPKGSACDFCYAESLAKRTGHPELWRGERRRTSEANWREPLKWQRIAMADGARPRVFGGSLCVTHGGLAIHEDGQEHKGKPSHWWSGDCWDGVISTRVGKKLAGRLLDGQEHNGFPEDWRVRG